MYIAKSSTSTDANIVNMSPSKNAVPGTYKIHVKKLATNSSIISGNINLAYDGIENRYNIDKELGIQGSFTIQNEDGISSTIDIVSGDSLKSIVDKINLTAKESTTDGEKIQGTGINATIIDSKLVLSDEKTGNRKITLIGDGKGTLVNLGLNKDARDERQGEDSVFTINGVEVVRSSNIVTDVIEYVTINLNKEHEEGKYDTIGINFDNSRLTKTIQDFVDQYNSTITFMEDKLKAGDPDVPGSKGALAGDGSLMRLHSSLRNLVTSKISNGKTDIKDISELGITTIDKYGQLKFDSGKLTNALKEDRENVMKFFISKDDEDRDIGFIPRLKDYIDSFISSDKGIIKGKNESFDKSLKDINDQVNRFNVRMEKKEAYYIKMFTALDVAMMQAESQMTWLEGQITAMNSYNKK